MKAAALDIAAERYHADDLADVPTLSATTAWTLYSQSPLHAWSQHPKLNPRYQPKEPTKAMDVGTAIHGLLLEPERESAIVTVDAADWRTKVAQAARDEIREGGRIAMLLKDWERAQEAVEAIRAQLAARDDDPPLLSDGKPERTLVWEEQPGVVCRVRADWLRDDCLAIDDLKTTTRTANPRDWCRRQIWEKPHLQAALYLRGVKALTGTDPAFRFIVVETSSPYALSVVDLAPSARDLAERRLDLVLATWKRCLEENEWPGYPAGVYSAEEPGWAESEYLERTFDDGEAA